MALGRVDLHQYRLRQRHQAGPANPLQQAKEDELVEAGGSAARRRGRGKAYDRDQEDIFDAKTAGEPAGQRHGDRRGDNVRGQDPGDLVLGGGEATLDMRSATLAIVLSTPCMIVASMIETVIAARLPSRLRASLLTAAPGRPAKSAMCDRQPSSHDTPKAARHLRYLCAIRRPAAVRTCQGRRAQAAAPNLSDPARQHPPASEGGGRNAGGPAGAN